MDTKILNLENSLVKKGYTVHSFETKEEAAKYMNEQIDNKSVGIGGSVTVKEMGLFPMLTAHNTVYWHDQKPENMTVLETRKAANDCEIYISSVNGASETGELINIDFTGNRVAAISFGPAKVYLVIGVNKIEENVEKAIWRARNIASPLNCIRLNRKTPCAVKGDKCYDCSSPDRLCRNFQILAVKPAGVDYDIILINEKLGY